MNVKIISFEPKFKYGILFVEREGEIPQPWFYDSKEKRDAAIEKYKETGRLTVATWHDPDVREETIYPVCVVGVERDTEYLFRGEDDDENGA